MANVDIRVGKKDSTFFSANPTLVLKDGQFIFNETTSELFIGDGVTQLSSLVAINGASYTLTASEIGNVINSTTDATPNDTDLVISVESSVAKKNTWTQIKSFLKTYFDTIYTTTSAVASQITSALSGYVNTSGLTTNYLPKASDSDTLSNSQIFDDGTNVGIGTASPTARGHFKGSTSVGVLSTDYAAKFDNSSNAPLLHIRNDGNVGVGTTSPNAKLSFGTYYINGVPSSSEQASHIKLYESGGVLFGFGVSTAFTRDYLNIAANNINGNIAFYTNGLNNIIINQNGRLGIRNKSTQNVADLAILTEDDSSSKYSIYIENTVFFPILTVRNDGNIGIGTSTPAEKLHVNGNVRVDNLTASQIVETDSNKNLISAAKGTAYNKNFGTTSGTVREGDKGVTVIYRDFTASAALTGTTAITLINSALIPANTVAVNDEIEINCRAQRNTSTGTASNYLYYNTSNTLSGATLIGSQSAAGGYFAMQRALYVKGASDSETINSSINASNSDYISGLATTSTSNFNIDWTADVYIIQAFANAAVGDNTTSRALMIKRARL